MTIELLCQTSVLIALSKLTTPVSPLVGSKNEYKTTYFIRIVEVVKSIRMITHFFNEHITSLETLQHLLFLLGEVLTGICRSTLVNECHYNRRKRTMDQNSLFLS